jgi:uncharacterized membrane protein YkvI
MVENEQIATLMIIFGVGYVAVFSIFVLLYWHAYRKRAELDLNEMERFDTRNEMQESVINVLIGLISIALASIGGRGYAALAGWVYMLLGPAMAAHGYIMGARRQKMERRLEIEAEAA